MKKAIRTAAPPALDPIPFNIPQPFKTELANGLRIVIFEDSRLPLLSLRLVFFSGDVHDPADLPGLTSAMTSLLTEGTENYSSVQIAEKIERLGASIGSGSSEDFTSISASSLSLYAEDMLEMMAEVVFRPNFPADELDLYKRNTIESLKFQRSQPGFLAGEQTAKAIFGDHPYFQPTLSPEDVERISREELAKFRAERFIPNNAVFVAVGSVPTDEMLQMIKDHFEDWEPGTAPHPSFPELPKRSVRSVILVDRPGSAQANIVIANSGFDRSAADYFPALVMNQILGAGASSRVFMNLREEKGYTYGAYTRIDSKKLAGIFEATAEVRTAVTGDSLKEFFYELELIRQNRVGDAELADAKNFLTGVFPIRAETQEGLTGLLVNQQLYGLPDDYLETYRANIDAVTAEEVIKAAQRYVRPEEVAIVIVGDAAELLPQAAPFADDIQIYDAQGEPQKLSDYDRPVEAFADVDGEWHLKMQLQGQSIPVKLILTQEEGSISGKLDTMLGQANIAAATLRGNRFNATAESEMQGQKVEFIISGEFDGDLISGSVSTSIVPDPLAFTGERVR